MITVSAQPVGSAARRTHYAVDERAEPVTGLISPETGCTLLRFTVPDRAFGLSCDFLEAVADPDLVRFGISHPSVSPGKFLELRRASST